MSKNLTRKGLALGALVSLATSVFAYAPANAAGESAGILVAPNKGTTYNSIVGTSFDLSTVLASSLSAKTELSYLVTNSAAAPIKLQYKGAADATVAQSVRTGTSAATVGTSADTTDATTSYTAKAIVVTGTSLGTNNSVDETSSLKNHLIVTTSTDSTENVVLTVQAFLDANNDGLLNNLDAYAAPVTLTFVPAASVTATTTITSSTIGTKKLQASVALGNDINQANIGAGVVFVQFKKNGSAVVLDDNTVSSDATFDSTDSVLKTNKTVTSLDVTADTYIAQAYFGASLATKLGSASNAAAPVNGTLSADSVDFVDAVASTNVYNRGVNATVNSTDVRADYTGSVTFGSKITWHSTDGTEVAAPAGVTVKVTLTNVALATASSFTAGGKTVTATSGAQSFTVLTDADGKVSFTGSGTAKKDDSVKIGLEVLKKTGGYTAIGKSTVVTYVAAAAQTAVVNTNLKGGSTVLKIAKGSSYTVNYTIKDQFGQPYTGAKYRTALSASGNAAFTYYVESAAGVLTQTIVDNSVATTGYTLNGTNLEKWNTTSLAWDAAGSITVPALTIVNDGVVEAAVSATATSSAAVATITKTLVNADLRVDNNSQTQKTIGYGSGATTPGTKHTVSGTVTSSTGAAVSGATVTVAAAGLGFVVNDGANAVYSVGSAVINTGAAGTYSVDIYSTTAGKQTVTVTSGAATKSVVIEYSGVTSLAETNVVSIDVASLSQVGRAVTATVKVVDKFANPVSGVAVAVSVTGVGSLSAATVTTDATGKGTVQFLAGANDFGDAVFTAKYTATDAAATVVSASKTVTVGITDAQIDVVGKRVTAVASFSKGKTVAFYVNGEKKWSKLSASDADVVLNYNLKKGRNTVTVKISGGFVTTDIIVVK